MLIDTHCHLDAEYFPDPDAVLGRARAAGVGRFVVVGIGADLGSARHAVSLARRRDDVFAAVGVHPHDASTLDVATYDALLSLAREPEVVAIGEIGLDYHYDHSPRDVQRSTFARLVRLARVANKPILVHTREAATDTLAILDDEGARAVGGIIHCFSEDLAFAERALAMDFDVSMSGIVTFKKADAVREVATHVPIERLHVETDSPYLAPVPLRGQPCEPAYVVHTARRVAELRGLSLDELGRALWDNALRRLRLAKPLVQEQTE